MKILIVNCHWDNRGDEAAIRALIDELEIKYPTATIYVQRALGSFRKFPTNQHVRVLSTFPIGGKKTSILEAISYISNGRINLTKGAKEFYGALDGASMVLHAPGGPSIGDLYLSQEKLKLRRLLMIQKSGVPYAFYAPSLGPFEHKKRNPYRKKVLEHASLVCLRESISKEYVKKLAPSVTPIVTLDSAFQHPIDLVKNQELLDAYTELREFMGDGRSVIGLTTTDLQWHALYGKDGEIEQRIRSVFTDFVSYLVGEGFKVLFIPQLFEFSNDFEYMNSFAMEHCFVMSDQYDCYFQQHVIACIKAVVGMRYHSNIFSAKMGTPFISVSYEQKMKGFMTKAGLEQYCLDVRDLSREMLIEKFECMMKNYDEYKAILEERKEEFRRESHRTTELVCEIIDKNKEVSM